MLCGDSVIERTLHASGLFKHEGPLCVPIVGMPRYSVFPKGT
jgi:hypothetical protein